MKPPQKIRCYLRFLSALFLPFSDSVDVPSFSTSTFLFEMRVEGRDENASCVVITLANDIARREERGGEGRRRLDYLLR
jgi:hypothetical protein